ncbi:transposase, partial [Kocuria palustris]|uniref:transposase n=1 Tax=Kocuria palustris TaxID=71999 RepID=UPI00344F2FD7
MPQKYTPEFKARALKLIEERVRAEQCSGWVSCTAVGEALGGISPHTLRNWWKQDRIDQGEAPGLSTAEAEEITKLRRENLELRRGNEMADSSGQCNISCEMGQSLTTGGSGCRASTVI